MLNIHCSKQLPMYRICYNRSFQHCGHACRIKGFLCLHILLTLSYIRLNKRSKCAWPHSNWFDTKATESRPAYQIYCFLCLFFVVWRWPDLEWYKSEYKVGYRKGGSKYTNSLIWFSLQASPILCALRILKTKIQVWGCPGSASSNSSF